MIREARADEAEALAEIQRDACLTAFAHIFPPDLSPFPMDEVRERWTTALADPDVSVLVADVDARAVGLAGYRLEWLDGLYVVPDVWTRGIGRELHDQVLARLRELGSTRCHLDWQRDEEGPLRSQPDRLPTRRECSQRRRQSGAR